MATTRKTAPPPPRRRKPVDPAEAANQNVLAGIAERAEAARVPIPDLGLGLQEKQAANASEFVDAWDKSTFGEVGPTITRTVYGPDPLFDSCPGMRAAIERVGLHDYAMATAGAILKNGPMAVADSLLRKGLATAISKFGVESVAEAFRDRILRIPCRQVEYEVERDLDVQIAGDRVLSDAVARYGRPGMAYKFLSPRCMDVLGMRGYELVVKENGDPVKVGTLHLGEIRQDIAEQRRAYYTKLANDSIDQEVEKYADEAERLARQSGHARVGPLSNDEIVSAFASEDEENLGHQRPAAFTLERNLNG